MLTGEIRGQIDRIWNQFWSGGISNPLEVIEQITYLLFIKRLDELHTAAEKKANRTQKPIENPIFKKKKHLELRWSRFRELEPEEMFNTVSTRVFPFIQEMGGDESTYARHMKRARFTIPSPALLARVVDELDKIKMDDRDTKGDVYEYMLGKLTTSGQNGQFRTPRHIIKLMVAMIAPKPNDVICDPACGTAGFLVAAVEYLWDNHRQDLFKNAASTKHYNENLFHGYDFDATMLRIGSMNMLLHGVENPNIRYKDSLAEAHSEDEAAYSIILANPPFAGSLDYDSTAQDLQKVVKTKKTELLFIALFLRLLRSGGRAAVIVPDGVLFGSSKAHKSLRKMLVEEHKLDAVIAMPSGVFKPYSGVSTAILFFTKTGTGGTKDVWFYDMQADGFSLDDKRTALDGKKHENDNIPDILKRWTKPSGETKRKRTEQSFLVPKDEIADNNYDLSINRYKEIEYEEIEYDPPAKILADLAEMEKEIQTGIKELQKLVK